MTTLLVCAHPDDEVLGVGGTIAKEAKKGEDFYALFLNKGDINRDLEHRRKCARKAADILGIKEILFDDFPNNAMNAVPEIDVTQAIERHFFELKPETVYTHNRYDVNSDHRSIFHSTLAAARAVPDSPVKQLLAFEVRSSTEWGYEPFKPNVYSDITETLPTKIEAMKVYDDELREYPHPRSVEGVEALAKYRGSSVGVGAAEAFSLVRMIK